MVTPAVYPGSLLALAFDVTNFLHPSPRWFAAKPAALATLLCKKRRHFFCLGKLVFYLSQNLLESCTGGGMHSRLRSPRPATTRTAAGLVPADFLRLTLFFAIFVAFACPSLRS